MMSKKVWVLCYEDNFGQIDLNNLFGGYDTKEQADAALEEITNRFGPQGFVVRQVDYKLIESTCV